MKALPVLAALAVSASIAQAQQTRDTVSIEPIVVTATRVPVALSKVTATVSVIDGAQLRRAGVRTVEEALRSVSGVAVVQSGSYGANTALFMRGGESDYVQVLVDGVQVNSPGEAFNWSTLSIEDVERIEVVKGPSSVLYGSDAVAGVVQVITKRGQGKAHGDINAMFGRGPRVGDQSTGSFNNGYVRGEVAGGTSKAGYSIGVSHFATEGAYAFNNDHRNTSVTGRASAQLNETTTLTGTARVNQSRFHYPTDGSGNLRDKNQFNDGRSMAFGAEAAHQFGSKVDAILKFEHNDNKDIIDDRADNAADTLGFFRYYSEQQFRRNNAELQFNVRPTSASTLTLGGEFEKQTNVGSSSSPFGDTPASPESRDNRAGYAQLLTDFDRVSLQLGARAEDNSKFGTFATYRGGVAARLTENARFHGSVGTAFRQPKFFEQFATGFVTGNPNLEPEKSRSFDAGVDLTAAELQLGASYFNQKFEDLIQYVAVSTGPNYLNVAAAKANGVEFTAAAPVGQYRANAQFTILTTEVTDDGDGNDSSFQDGEELLRRPKYSGSVALSRVIGAGSMSATLNYVGERDDLDFSSFPAKRVTLPSYLRVDLASQQRVSDAVSIMLKIENALDKKYQEVLGFPAKQRVLFAGAQVNF